MSIQVRCTVLLAILFSVNAEEARRATAVLIPRNNIAGTESITGTIVFTETADGLRVTGNVTGLSQGKYGFHVHELGNTLSCDDSGAHFNPEGTTHGGRDHEIRHVGDLGNIEFNDAGVANIDLTDHMLTLRGQNNILGRTLVLHAEEDDLGLGNVPESLTTGNAGARVACGVIGIMYPSDPWNSAVTSSPSILLFVATALFVYLRN